MWRTWFVQSCRGLGGFYHKGQRNVTKQRAHFQYSNWDWQYFKNSFIPVNSAMSGTAEVITCHWQLPGGRHLVLFIPILSHAKMCSFSKTPFLLASSPERPVPERA